MIFSRWTSVRRYTFLDSAFSWCTLSISTFLGTLVGAVPRRVGSHVSLGSLPSESDSNRTPGAIHTTLTNDILWLLGHLPTKSRQHLHSTRSRQHLKPTCLCPTSLASLSNCFKTRFGVLPPCFPASSLPSKSWWVVWVCFVGSHLPISNCCAFVSRRCEISL